MKAVIYARYSSDNQREESIEGQVRECIAFAERKGYTVIHTYIDRALSGTRADNRPEFQQMISDSTLREFQYVIVWKIDRFSRDKFDSVKYKYALKSSGVSVIFATEPIDGSPEGQMMESVFEGISVYYIKDLAQKTSRGMTENAIKGKFNGGTLTFGYTIDENHHFQLDPVNAPIVLDVFTRYSEGETIRSILDDINSKMSNNGRKFTYHFLNWMLNNRRYLGEYKFQDTINNEAIPPIVSQELFDKCQHRLNVNKHKAGSFKNNKEKYLLTGKIFCGNCGATISGISGTGKCKSIYRYYKCMNVKKHKCRKKPVQKELIENIVLNAAMDIFKDKALIRKISKACFDLQSKESPMLPALKRRLRENQKEIKNLMNAIKAGIVLKTTKAELEKLESEHEQLETNIAMEKLVKPVIPQEKIQAWLMNFAAADLSDHSQKQRIIDIFVNSVYVYDDRVVVFVNYKDGERCVDFSVVSDSGNPEDAGNSNEKKTNTHENECSPLIKSGDPYGNRKSFRAFRIFLQIAEFRMIEPFTATYGNCVSRNFSYVFAAIMIKNLLIVTGLWKHKPLANLSNS